jgi:hypothetical protein
MFGDRGACPLAAIPQSPSQLDRARMRIPLKNKVPDRPDSVTNFFSACDTRGAPLYFGVGRDYRGERDVLEEPGGPKCLP